MKKKLKLQIGFMATVITAMVMVGCSCEDESVETGEPTAGSQIGIPEDKDATDAPSITNPNVTLPNPAISVGEEKGYGYAAIDMTGVWDEQLKQWLKLRGTADNKSDQNVWVTVDDIPKGIDVYNVSEGDSRTLLADVVFLVDNSGSMSEEADAVAESIIQWSEALAQAGLDLRVGCVGYGDSYHAIDGALNMTTPALLSDYLNQYKGTMRTHYYGGNDAASLEEMAEGGAYENGSYNECGMVALRFAHDKFNFRGGSNRVYVNFTDEPNQPANMEKWSVEYLNPETGNNWKSNYGTIHTVFSEEEYQYWQDLSYEKPWLMSEYTGGTVIFVDRYAKDWDLTKLPVTGAMQNSYMIRFTNIDQFKDGQVHTIKITVQSENVQSEKIIKYNFSTGEFE